MLFGLPKALLPMYALVFLDVLGLTILIPLLPTLAQKLHAAPALLGAALSTTAVCATISSPLWGRLSDKAGRKPVLLWSQGFSFVGYLLLGFANSLPLLFVSRAIEGLGGGNLGVAQSYIADVTTEDQRGKAYAFGAAAFGLGFVIGPVFAGQLVRVNDQLPFFVAAGMQGANLLLTTFFLASTRAPRAKSSAPSIVQELRKPVMLNLLAREFFYIFSFTYFFTVFSLYLARELHMPPEYSSLFLAVAGGVGAAVQLLGVDRLTRRFGTYALSQASFVLGFIAYAAMFFIGQNIAVFVVVLVLWAISGSVLRPTLNTLIADAASDEHRGAVLGFADSLNNASMIVAPTAAGAVLMLGPAYIGFLPAFAIAVAYVLGIRGRRAAVTR